MRDKKTNNSTKLIKKYRNRRLYYSAERRYVTLKDIREMIEQGCKVQILDTKSKRDITNEVLVQAILESERSDKDLLPVAFLHKLIRYGNQLSRNYLEKSFVMMMEPYTNNLREGMYVNNAINMSEYRYNNTPDKNSNDTGVNLEQIQKKMDELEEKIRMLSK